MNAKQRHRFILIGFITLLGGLITVPLGVILSSFLSIDITLWQHLLSYVLPDLLVNTVLIALGTLVLTCVFGVGLAWITSMYEFPASRYLTGGLILPLCFPTYVLAFIQSGLFDYGGLFREYAPMIGINPNTHFPEMRSVLGAVWIMSLSFYPYVYLLSRNAFMTMGNRALEIGQSLGRSKFKSFFYVVLPMSKPWIVGGGLLVLMETLADFGAVSILNVDTFTTAIYKSWFSLYSLNTASQLASLLMLIAGIMIVLESKLRGVQRYTSVGRQTYHYKIRLKGWRGLGLTCGLSLFLMIVFIIPTSQLCLWSYESYQTIEAIDDRYWGFVSRSISLSLLAAVLITTIAIILVYAQRHFKHSLIKHTIHYASLGYAIPGSVLAIGIFITMTWIDNHVIVFISEMFDMINIDLNLNLNLNSIIISIFNSLTSFKTILLSLSIMIWAYLIRFLNVALQPAQTALERITQNQELAARQLGYTHWRLLKNIHLPMMRSGLITALLLVFVDVMKELPITLMTRPFGWDTLAIRIFELTSEGQWYAAALPALFLVCVGFIPVGLLLKHNH